MGNWLWVMGLVTILLITHLPSLITSVQAEGEFSSSYDVKYDVGVDGVTQVTEKITFKNLTDRFYPSNFSLIIAASQISDISAYDSGSNLITDLKNQGKKSLISVNFNNQQIVGRGKEYTWTLEFKSRDFALNNGKVWEVTVPKLKDTKGVESYKLTLSLPVSFGDPTTILPEPVAQSESGDKINFIFNKEQLSNSGVFANFGSEQLIDFKSTFNIANNRFLPHIVALPLPSDNDYQDVVIDDIFPKPENVVSDTEGNLTAYFNLERKQTIQVLISGRAKLHNKTPSNKTSDFSQYIVAEKYWEKDNPVIQSRLNEIFSNGHPKTNTEKARLINKFLVNNIGFDFDRISTNDFQRLGALTTLNNPDKALDSEYSDLFIALCRAAKIPARLLVGYATSPNPDIRPLSYQGKILHSWAEYYDPLNGWNMVDPAWEATTGGVDYFSSVDLNHLVLERLGHIPNEEFTLTQLDVKFSDEKITANPDLVLSIEAPEELLAGFPAQAKIIIENHGNKILDGGKFSFSSGQIRIIPVEKLEGEGFTYPVIPPFGRVSYKYNLKTSNQWQAYSDVFELRVGSKKVVKNVKVKPIFAHQYFSILLGFFTTVMVVSYIFILLLHFKAKAKT